MRSQKGISLFELILVFSLLASLVWGLLPEWSTFFQQQRQHQAGMLLERLLLYARHLAVLRHESVLFCLSVDNQHCSSGPAQYGLVTVVEEGKPYFYRREQLTEQGSFYWRGFGHNDGVTFSVSGLVKQNGSFYYRGEAGRQLFRISINKLAQVKWW